MLTQLTPESLRQFRALYFRLAADYPHSALLDSCGWEGVTGGFYLMAFEAQTVVKLYDGWLWVNGSKLAEIHDKATLWHQLEALFPQSSRRTTKLPFEDGWIGVLGYELNHLLEPMVPAQDPENPMGPLYFVRFRHVITWQPEQDEFQVITSSDSWRQKVEALLASGELASAESPENSIPKAGAITSSFTQPQFESQVQVLQEHIRAGDIYQANLSMRFEATDIPESTLAELYKTLVTRNPSPFSGIFWTPEGIILSNSPERLVKYDAASNILETRPIAGTRGRGKTAEEESAIEQVLKTDTKEQAEHLMLLDLERNDLGRVAAPATVHVPQAYVLERYSHVTHLVSQVEAQKDPQKSRWEVLEAMFPGGTITGCPKVRCMEILQATEPVPRGFYTGSLGYLDVSGNLDFNILIRSLFHWPDQRLHFHAGAGIVADSVPAWEYRECLRKAEVIQGVLCHDHISTP